MKYYVCFLSAFLLTAFLHLSAPAGVFAQNKSDTAIGTQIEDRETEDSQYEGYSLPQHYYGLILNKSGEPLYSYQRDNIRGNAGYFNLMAQNTTAQPGTQSTGDAGQTAATDANKAPATAAADTTPENTTTQSKELPENFQPPMKNIFLNTLFGGVTGGLLGIGIGSLTSSSGTLGDILSIALRGATIGTVAGCITEQELGRLRTGKRWDNRLIDIDILLIGQQIHQLPELTVPHYQLHLRDFFLIPLAEIACDTSIPPEGLTPVQLLRRIPKEYLTSPEPTGITLP
ncbi:hypothetical protein CHS0354_030071 [Potamilus streckersoni]|uniref:2-amino-4-hydroxy-6-hydroxymethyldihydropteridine diphosphokinase n=1 Tax=Potamilus streckersoni TaxID=2493646 RepID=A0AAE0RLC7_9BIVA|nr:hypothetical protein CHS0354_030071 [Potamilus streckersoni]